MAFGCLSLAVDKPQDAGAAKYRGEPGEAVRIAIDDMPYIVGAMLAPDGPGLVMERVDLICEPGDQCDIKPAGLGDIGKQRLVGDAAHFEQPVDRLAAAADAKAFSGSYDRMHREIHVRCRPAIEAKLSFERSATQWRGREVEIGIFYRSLQFPRPVPRQKKAGGVRINLRAAMAVIERGFKESDEIALAAPISRRL